jgi:hypothetical protein
MQAYLMDLAPLVDLARPYEKIKNPVIPGLPDEQMIKESVKVALKNTGALTWWPPTRNQLIRDRIIETQDDLQFESAVLKSLVEEAFNRFENLDPAINMIVLQASFADNAGTAAPIALDGDHLIVLMSYPSIEDAIWPEIGIVTDGRFTIKKRTKKQTVERYRRNLMCHTAATAKEAFRIQPRLETVSVVVVPELPDERLAALPVTIGAKFRRKEILHVSMLSDNSWIQTWDSCLRTWECPEDNEVGWVGRISAAGVAFSNFMDHSSGILKAASDTLNELNDTWMFRISNKIGFKPIGVLGDLLSTDDLDTAGVEGVSFPIDTPVHNPEAIHDCLFWIEALEMAEGWITSQDNNGDSNAQRTQPAHESPDSFWAPVVDRLKSL